MGQNRGQWETLSSKVVHQNPYYSVREDSVIKPDGSKGFYDVVEGKGSVFIVAVDESQNIHLIGLHRYTNNNYSIEIPAGGTDGQAPLIAAQRELREELGLMGQSWKQLGVIYQANGIMSEECYVFLATELTPIRDDERKEEGITASLTVSFDKAFLMIKAGEITDANTIAPLLMAAMELNIVSPNLSRSSS